MHVILVTKKALYSFFTVLFLFSAFKSWGFVSYIRDNSRSNASPVSRKEASLDSLGYDTLSIEQMNKYSMDDVDSMTVNPERTRAFVKMKSGKKYIVIINDDLRKAADEKYSRQQSSSSPNIEKPTSIPGDTSTKNLKESEFEGGLKAWYQFLGKNLIYPDNAIRNEVQGQVIVRFIVEADGTVVDYEAISGPLELRQASVDVIKKSSGKWTPATKDGKPVRSYKTQPINFKLESR